MEVTAAQRLAEDYLAVTLGRRWRHVQAVAARSEEVAATLSLDRQVLVCAAWLHDIGYSPDASDTGFHPLDGARLLRRLGVDRPVVDLVANHSCAVIEADERGLEDQLRAEFPSEPSLVADALWFCDMTTGPDGELLSVGERLAEAKGRYGDGDIVTRFIERATPAIYAAVDRIEAQLRAAGQVV